MFEVNFKIGKISYYEKKTRNVDIWFVCDGVLHALLLDFLLYACEKNIHLASTLVLFRVNGKTFRKNIQKILTINKREFFKHWLEIENIS